MTLFDLPHSTAAGPKARIASPTLLLASLAGYAVVASMFVIDGPVAQWAAQLPSSITRAVDMTVRPFKGAVLLGSVAAVLALSWLLSRAGSPALAARAKSICSNAAFVLCATLLALLIATALKILIGRARPELMALYGPLAFFPLSTSHALASFPSGETSMAAAFFGSVAYTIRDAAGRYWALLIAAPALWIAASRVILGQHYVSDVMAAGLVALAAMVAVARLSERAFGHSPSHT